MPPRACNLVTASFPIVSSLMYASGQLQSTGVLVLQRRSSYQLHGPISMEHDAPNPTLLSLTCRFSPSSLPPLLGAPNHISTAKRNSPNRSCGSSPFPHFPTNCCNYRPHMIRSIACFVLCLSHSHWPPLVRHPASNNGRPMYPPRHQIVVFLSFFCIFFIH